MTYFHQFQNEKIQFENFRLSAQNWLSVKWVKNVEFFQRISIIQKSLILAFLSLNDLFSSISEWKNPVWKFSTFSSKLTLSQMGEKCRLFAKYLNHPKITIFVIFEPRWRIFSNFRMKKSTLKIFDFQLKNSSQSNRWKMSTFCKGSQSSKNHCNWYF